MAVGEAFSEPRTVKSGEVVMDQLVELRGPRSLEVLVVIGVLLLVVAMVDDDVFLLWLFLSDALNPVDSAAALNDCMQMIMFEIESF